MLHLQEVYQDQTLNIRRPKQVFTSAGASGILTNDLVRILADRGAHGIEADAVQGSVPDPVE
jgi:hypothetical protein